MFVKWPQFKKALDQRGKSPLMIEQDDFYYLELHDGTVLLTTKLYKNRQVSEIHVLDFEQNYKNKSNATLEPTDSGGAKLTRNKTTETGWHYEPRALDFYTSKLDSLYNRKDDGAGIDDGTDYDDATIKFYNDQDVELVQGVTTEEIFQNDLDTNCVKTVVDWQAKYDFDIIGGTLQVKNPPQSRAYIWSTIAPDIPASLGGSVPYFAGGFNLSFFFDGQFEQFNGRGTKSFKYDPIFNSNKIRFTVKHPVGSVIGLQIILDQFKM